jgi:hypothetical protein
MKKKKGGKEKEKEKRERRKISKDVSKDPVVETPRITALAT